MGSAASKKSNSAQVTNNIEKADQKNEPKIPRKAVAVQNQHERPKIQMINAASATDTNVKEVLHGNPNYGYKSHSKIVRIFTSSTFTDTQHERNHLMVTAYPKLKEFCRHQGYEFQVIDMRWGVREQSENDHTAMELCLKEVKACQELSTGPNFVTFLSHKYGYRPFPRCISAEEFDKITNGVTDEDEELLDAWFELDENMCPKSYILQPISQEFPDFLSADRDKRKQAKHDWWKVYKKLADIIDYGVKHNIQDAARRQYFMMSVTEREVSTGILHATDPNKNCLWFRRIFDDIEKQEPCEDVSRYYECLGSPEDVKLSRKMLSSLTDNQLPKKLAKHNIKKYHIPWKPNGVNPQDASHHQYLDQLSDDFVKEMKRQIEAGIEEKQAALIKNKILEEVLEQFAFRHTRCHMFSGRQDQLLCIERYVRGKGCSPLVVYGDAGCGKTSLIAKATDQAWMWLSGKGAVVYRFLGTTTSSSALRKLIASINQQLALLYQPTLSATYWSSMDLKVLLDGFLLLLQAVPSTKPLVLFLDAVDQMDSSDAGQQMEWLPTELPDNVKVILSMPSAEGCFLRCKVKFQSEDSYLQVGALGAHEVEQVLDKWLLQAQRNLTQFQKQVLLQGFQYCSNTLYLRLAFDESLRWHSYDPPEVTRLRASVKATIKALFTRLEKTHGQLLVSFALSYLTCAQDGLTEAELEDMLSLNDVVLGDVYQYWVPPVRRLPPSLISRIKADLETYLANRGVDGLRVIYWYYQEFSMTVREKYLANEESRQICHSLMADFYLGTWADTPKPYKNKAGEVVTVLRYVAQQPLVYNSGAYNLRKLNQLPYHLTHAGQLQQLKQQCLCNYEFLFAKISAAGPRVVLNDLKHAQQMFPKDADISILLETLQLSQVAILADPHQLAAQLIGRMYMNPSSNTLILHKAKEALAANQFDSDQTALILTLTDMLEGLVDYQKEKYATLLELLSQARRSSALVLVPNTACLVPPGGQLLHKLSDHLEKVNDIAVSYHGNILATGSDDNTVKVWGVETGELKVSVQLKVDVVYICFYPNDKYLAASTIIGDIYIIDVSMGAIVKDVTNPLPDDHYSRPITVCEMENKSFLIISLCRGELHTLDAESGVLYAKHPDGFNVPSIGKYSNKKHVVSYKSTVVYASFGGNSFFIMKMKSSVSMTPQEVCLFDVTEVPSDMDGPTIVALDLISDGQMVALVNALKQSLHLYSTENCAELRQVSLKRAKLITQISYSAKEDAVYFSSQDHVGVLGLKDGDHRNMLQHPCRILKVLSCGGRFVVTLGEDSITRIWDQVMKPFSPDVSLFTGKVTVQSETILNNFRGVLDTFASEFNQDLEDTRALLTTDDAKNYWSKNHGSIGGFDIRMKYMPMANTRYVVISHVASNPHTEASGNIRWTQCITIWDLNKVLCVRRMFPPVAGMYVQAMLPRENTILFTALGDEGSPLYKIEKEKDRYKVALFSDAELIQPNSDIIIIDTLNLMLGENTKGDLFLLDLGTYQVKCHLSRPVHLVSPAHNSCSLYSHLQCVAADHIIGIHSGHFLCIWQISTQKLFKELDLTSHMKGIPESHSESHMIRVCLSQDKKFAVVTVDDPNSQDISKIPTSSAIVQLETGNYKGNISSSANLICQTTAVVLRCSKECKLQMIGIDNRGYGSVLSSAELNISSNRVVVTAGGTRAVTWCASAQDRTLQYWSLLHSSLTRLAGFTADDEIDQLYVGETEEEVYVSWRAGLIRLTLEGEGVSAPTLPYSQRPISFKENELNVELEL